ncbi:adult enhancer factor 1-like isoform X1 [Dermacentor silvarum]|uniref:adult enhancer factor 1-like isoform X1 n=1 Tax=Dermacentor silvarum TaxID=543639 RepID=UPI002100DC59|nr:adult enhancer factor 1-like isoform X1 [Dermacentor silvarum]
MNGGEYSKHYDRDALSAKTKARPSMCHQQTQSLPVFVSGCTIHCNMCSFSTAQVGTMEQHQLTHTGERPFVCNYCPRTFARCYDLKMHVRIHTDERPYSCPICPSTFHQKSNLQRHMVSHTDERPYKCKRCTRSYRSSSALDYHVKRCTVPMEMPPT